MSKRIVILGAGGHGHVVADLIRNYGNYSEILFLDDACTEREDASVVGKFSDFTKFLESSDFFVAVGDNRIRKKIFEQLQKRGANITTLIHPGAIVGSKAAIGKGSIIMAGAIVGPDAIVGEGVIVNTNSSIDHNCSIGAFSHISVGCNLAGTVTVGQGVFLGIGATVINNITICDNCTVGAGAVVVKDLSREGVYVGIPAKLKGSLEI